MVKEKGRGDDKDKNRNIFASKFPTVSIGARRGAGLMKFSVKSTFAINPTTITFGTIIVVVSLFLSDVSILELVELKTYDLRFRSRGQQQPSSSVVMALIDDKSIEMEGRWPWPRSKIAKLVNILSNNGAKVIGFDIGFFEPSQNAQLEFIEKFSRKMHAMGINNPNVDAFVKNSQAEADNDRMLANAIKNSTASIVLGYFFHMNAEDINYHIDERQINAQLAHINRSKYPLIIYKEKEMKRDPFIRAFAPVSNLGIFSQSGASSGFFSLKSDQDGVVRWIPLIIKSGEDLYPPLSLLCAWHYLDKPQLMVKVAHYGIEGIQMGKHLIPTDENGGLLINFLGSPKTFPNISIGDVLSGKTAEGFFENKIVLVGVTSSGMRDLRSTPISPLYPGVEVHATVIDNLLTQQFMTKPKWSKVFDLFAIIVLGALTGIALPRFGAAKGLLLAVSIFLLYILTARWLFVNQRIWLNMVFPLLVLSLNYTVLTAYRYVTEERERKKVKGAFRQYVAPLVIDELLEAPEKLKLGGEEKELTVLFSDIEGFTTYSEHYSPSEMIDILSDYYDKMTEQIFRHQGTLKEYVGDEIMAFFGAPIDAPDHAQRACGAALTMREARHALNSEWIQRGRPQLRARIGINTGPMLVGNLGSSYRFAYGVLGDQVNLGSRLEGLNKIYGTEILTGKNTVDLAKNDFLFRKIDSVRVVGRQQCVNVYELVDRSIAVLPKEQAQAFAYYAAGYAAYCEQHWDKALDFFNRGLEAWQDDGPSRTMAQRCRIYRESPPPGSWDCIFEPDTK
jgi:adenylate cyclase